jgi:hypothetical protein
MDVSESSWRRTPMASQANETPLHITLNGQLNRRVERATWATIRPYMRYYDAELIEEMDWFGMVPGWYVTDEEAVERLLAVPEEWRVAPRRERAKQEAKEAEEWTACERLETAERIQRKQEGYADWRAQHLTGLERFHDWFEGFPALEWEEIASFDKEAGWFNTGDRWGRSTWNGEVIYRNQYGNTSVYYTTRANAVKLARLGVEWHYKFYPTPAEMARHLLMTHLRGCIGDDHARIVVEEDGLQHYIDIARQEVWYLVARDHATDEFWQTAERYGLPHVELTPQKRLSDYSYQWHEALRERLAALHPNAGYCQYAAVYFLPDGNRWFVSAGHAGAPAVPAPDLSDLFPELRT